MSYSFQTFTVGQVLTASQMNQVEVNIRDHVHGVAGVVGGNNVIALSTDTVSWGNSTTETTILSFGIPANAIGSNSVIRVTAQCYASVSSSATLYLNGYLDGTAVCSFSMHGINVNDNSNVFLNGAYIAKFLISGGGVTSRQLCSLYMEGFTIYVFDQLANFSIITNISTTNKDATSALNCAIKADSSFAHADTKIIVSHYMVERIYL